MSMYHEVLEGTVSRGTGAKKVAYRDKVKAHIGRPPTETKLGEKEKREKIRTKGGNRKIRLKKVVYANVLADGKYVKAKILRVIESNNPDYTRRNVIVNGAIIEVEGLGKARVTSRPGQDGVVNAVLVK
jgi:small subunit ribosomal protein S8e